MSGAEERREAAARSGASAASGGGDASGATGSTPRAGGTGSTPRASGTGGTPRASGTGSTPRASGSSGGGAQSEAGGSTTAGAPPAVAPAPVQTVRAEAPPLRGVVVSATDTEVGKTVLAAAICARLRADGVDVVAHKPAVTGLDDPAPAHGRDHELLAACTGQTPDQVCPRRFGPAVSPHLAAELAAERLVPADLVAAAARAGQGRTLVVEGVGGLLVPFDRAGYDVRALAVDLGLPVVLAARPGLGTINHVRLTVEVARAAGLDVRAIVLTPWPAGDGLADDNRRTIAALTDVPTHVLPLAEPTPAGLAAAALELPVAGWIGEASSPGAPAGRSTDRDA